MVNAVAAVMLVAADVVNFHCSNSTTLEEEKGVAICDALSSWSCIMTIMAVSGEWKGMKISELESGIGRHTQ